MPFIIASFLKTGIKLKKVPIKSSENQGAQEVK